jgi:hypothetical protein
VACCEVEHQLFLLVDGGFNRESVEIKEHGHRGMRDAFVAIDEGGVIASPKANALALSTTEG